MIDVYQIASNVYSHVHVRSTAYYSVRTVYLVPQDSGVLERREALRPRRFLCE